MPIGVACCPIPTGDDCSTCSPEDRGQNNGNADERTPLCQSYNDACSQECLLERAERLSPLVRILQTLFILLDIVWILVLIFDLLSGTGLQPTQCPGFCAIFMTTIGVFMALQSALFPCAQSNDKTLCLVISGLILVNSLIEFSMSTIFLKYGLTSFFVTLFLTLFSIFLAIPKCNAEYCSTFFGRMQTYVKEGIRIIIFLMASMMTINTLFRAIDHQNTIPSIYNIENTNIRLTCVPTGDSGPVALLEPGSTTTSSELFLYASHIEGFKTVCYWDKPGFGLSDNAPSPLSLGMTVDFLQKALDEDPHVLPTDKFVLLAHGTGSLYSRIFSARTGYDVAGIVLMEPLHEELYYREQSFLHGLKLFFTGIFSPGSYHNIKGLLTGRGTEDRLFGQASLRQPGVYKYEVQQKLSARSISYSELESSIVPLNTPLLLLSSSIECTNEEWTKYQKLHLRLTNNPIAWKIITGPHILWRNKQGAEEATNEIQQFLKYAIH